MDASEIADFNDIFAARRYIDPGKDSFWDWRDGGEVITWRSGATIAFRPEIVEVLARLAPHGLPWFDAVVMFFAACRAQGKVSERELANYGIEERPASPNPRTRRADVGPLPHPAGLAALSFPLPGHGRT